MYTKLTNLKVTLVSKLWPTKWPSDWCRATSIDRNAIITKPPHGLIFRGEWGICMDTIPNRNSPRILVAEKIAKVWSYTVSVQCTPCTWAELSTNFSVLLTTQNHNFMAPAHNKGILRIMVIITDRKSTNKDVSFMRSRSSHQLYLWKTCFITIFNHFQVWFKRVWSTCNAAISSWQRLVPKIPAVIISANIVLNTLLVIVTVALSVATRVAPGTEPPILTWSNSNRCWIPACCCWIWRLKNVDKAHRRHWCCKPVLLFLCLCR